VERVLRLALACVLAAAVVAAVAILDHRHKLGVENAQSVEAWFCNNGRPERCTGFDVDSYEQRWERRELVYEAGVVALGASALAFGAAAAVRSRT
jgi:hypothetical protein